MLMLVCVCGEEGVLVRFSAYLLCKFRGGLAVGQRDSLLELILIIIMIMIGPGLGCCCGVNDVFFGIFFFID